MRKKSDLFPATYRTQAGDVLDITRSGRVYLYPAGRFLSEQVTRDQAAAHLRAFRRQGKVKAHRVGLFNGELVTYA